MSLFVINIPSGFSDATKNSLLEARNMLQEMKECHSSLQRDISEKENIIQSLTLKLEQRKHLAAKTQFLYYIIAKIKEFEFHLSGGLYIDDIHYEFKIRNSFNDANAQELRGGEHYRRFIVILHWGDEKRSGHLAELKKRLNARTDLNVSVREVYHSFAQSIQQVLEVSTDDEGGCTCGTGEFGLEFMKKDEIQEYLSFFADNVKADISTFYLSGAEQNS